MEPWEVVLVEGGPCGTSPSLVDAGTLGPRVPGRGLQEKLNLCSGSFLVLVLEGLIGLHRTVQLQLLQHGRGADLDCCVIDGFTLETEIILSFLSLPPSTAFQALVDHDGYSISSRGFLLQ